MEQQVAGEHHAFVRKVHDDIAAGVGRAQLEQHCPTVANKQLELAVESPRRGDDLDAVELEVPEDPLHEGTYLTEIGRGRHEPSQHRRRHLVHLGRAGRRGDDLRAADELVAVAVVAVGVSVDADIDLVCRRRRVPHPVEHLGGQPQVEQRVDQQRAVTVDHEPGVAPTPAAIGLQPCPDPVPDLVQPTLVADCHRQRPYRSHAPDQGAGGSASYSYQPVPDDVVVATTRPSLLSWASTDWAGSLQGAVCNPSTWHRRSSVSV